MSIKESNFNGKNGSTFSDLFTVRVKGADPPSPYGPDRKISVFLTTHLRLYMHLGVNMLDLEQILIFKFGCLALKLRWLNIRWRTEGECGGLDDECEQTKQPDHQHLISDSKYKI